MAKDDRLYARFDIHMDEHAKIILLSDAAFRALHEATYYARRQLTDGFLAEGVVHKKWGRDVAPELTTNHPERPSWVRVDGGWQIHDFAEHQTTNADIQTKRASGRLGGLAKAKGAASTSVAPASETLEQKGSTILAKTETETETETETTTSKEVVPTAGAKLRESRIPADWVPMKVHFDLAAELKVNITAEAEAFRLHAETHDRHAARWNAAFTTWLKKSKPSVAAKRDPNAWMNA